MYKCTSGEISLYVPEMTTGSFSISVCQYIILFYSGEAYRFKMLGMKASTSVGLRLHLIINKNI